MKAVKCDRCGKFYDCYKGYECFNNSGKANCIQLIDRGVRMGESIRKSYDLCQKCMRELEKFIGGGGLDGEKENLNEEANEPGAGGNGTGA
jgi:hypothetical protein